MKRFLATSAVTLTILCSTAWAGESDLGYAAIAAKDWKSAETQLRQELVSMPEDPLRLVNLAFVLQQQGRAAEATQVYQQVLAAKSNPKVAVGTANESKPLRVKAVASRGIETIEKAAR